MRYSALIVPVKAVAATFGWLPTFQALYHRDDDEQVKWKRKLFGMSHYERSDSLVTDAFRAVACPHRMGIALVRDCSSEEFIAGCACITLGQPLLPSDNELSKCINRLHVRLRRQSASDFMPMKVAWVQVRLRPPLPLHPLITPAPGHVAGPWTMTCPSLATRT